MDFEKLIEKKEGILLKNVQHFHPKEIFECGQCFRWTPLNEEKTKYQGVVHGCVLEVHLQGEDVYLHGVSKALFQAYFLKYFDLDRSYQQVKEVLQRDPLLKKSIAHGEGIRILQQDPFETLITFILSSNNLIPKIKEGIKRISSTYGEEMLFQGEIFYAFPTPEALAKATEEELRAMGLGYRAKYIAKTATLLKEARRFTKEKKLRPLTKEEQRLCAYDLAWIQELPEEECLKALMKFPGVGIKVADCVMLFSMGKTGAFPVDVWVKKAMVYFYGAEPKSLPKMRSFAKEQFGSLAGFAQQYLFYYAREEKIKLP